MNFGRSSRLVLPVLAALVMGSARAHGDDLSGWVRNGSTPLASLDVTLFASDPAHPDRCADALGSDRTAADGSFGISFELPGDADSVIYLIADAPRRGGGNAGGCRSFGGSLVLASVLGTASSPLPSDAVVNGRTTVAAAYALGQFIDGSKIAGKSSGFPNAAGMAGNLADAASGEASAVLANAPNGSETETLGSFNSLANMIAACAASRAACSTLFELAKPARGPKPSNTLQALVNIARYPARSSQVVSSLFELSKQPPAPYQPARPSNTPPAAWTLALRFVGDGVSMDGPGNFAIDEEGTLWVANNYTYSPDPNGIVCGSKVLLRFAPTGQYVPGSPYSGSGLDGAGYGVALDPTGNVWVGNFGFASPGCVNPPGHDTVSHFHPDGSVVAGAESGYTDGGIDWPQGTVSDRQGNIWIANCGNGVVTQYPAGDPTAALQFQPDPSCTGVAECSRPFDIAFNHRGWAFVTLNEKDSVAVLRPDGTPIPHSPIDAPGLFDHPLGIAADSHGNMWVANSASLRIPCPNGFLTPETTDGTITMIRHDGKATKGPFIGGGLTIPWGIAVDGDDNVWVANFFSRRLSHFCGRDPGNCPPGARTGSPISPESGYAFDGFTRNTGVAIDRSGNVWVANNWKNQPNPAGNPGGYEIVAFVGLAPPIATPLIGPPRKP